MALNPNLEVIQALATKQLSSLTLPGVTITVETQQVGAAPLSYFVSATAGESVVEQVFTIGGNMGAVPAQSLQAEVDGYRQQVAELAAVQEHNRLAALQIT
jgi:hypothetical protein